MRRLLDEMKAGVPSFGAWQCLASNLSAEILGRAGFDWVLTDLQHGGADWTTLLGILQALELGGTLPMVRVASNDPVQIMRALDLEPAGS